MNLQIVTVSILISYKDIYMHLLQLKLLVWTILGQY